MEAIDNEFGIEIKNGVMYFNEDEHNEKVINNIKENKASGLNKWIRRFLPWKDPVLFNPVLLSDEQYKAKATENFDKIVALLDSNEWKNEKQGTQNGDVIQTINHETYGKIFLLTATVDWPADLLFNEIVTKVDHISEWNPVILESKCIKRIDSEVEISYQLVAGGGGGAVKPRDFINLRCSKPSGDRLISAGYSIEYPGYPPTSHMRGDNKIGCWCVKKLAPKNPDDPEQCCFQWMMCTDMKGWLPQYIIDVALPTAMLDFLQHMRVFIEKKKSEKAI